jgi:hypothetical protein
LLDELTAKVSINQTSNSSLHGIHKGSIVDAVLSGKLRQGFGFEDTQKPLYGHINYSLYNYIAGK